MSSYWDTTSGTGRCPSGVYDLVENAARFLPDDVVRLGAVGAASYVVLAGRFDVEAPEAYALAGAISWGSCGVSAWALAASQLESLYSLADAAGCDATTFTQGLLARAAREGFKKALVVSGDKRRGDIADLFRCVSFARTSAEVLGALDVIDIVRRVPGGLSDRYVRRLVRHAKFRRFVLSLVEGGLFASGSVRSGAVLRSLCAFGALVWRVGRGACDVALGLLTNWEGSKDALLATVRRLLAEAQAGALAAQ